MLNKMPTTIRTKERIGGSKKSRLMVLPMGRDCLTSETVQGTTLPLQSIHNVHGSHGLALGVLSVGHCITNNVLEEDLEDTTSFLVDESRNTLHTTTAGQPTNGRLGDALDIVTQHLTVAFRTSLPQTLSTLATTRHDSCSQITKMRRKTR